MLVQRDGRTDGLMQVPQSLRGPGQAATHLSRDQCRRLQHRVLQAQPRHRQAHRVGAVHVTREAPSKPATENRDGRL